MGELFERVHRREIGAAARAARGPRGGALLITVKEVWPLCDPASLPLPSKVEYVEMVATVQGYRPHRKVDFDTIAAWERRYAGVNPDVQFWQRGRPPCQAKAS